MDPVSPYPAKTKSLGILLLALGIGTGIAAQIVLDLSIAATSVYWESRDWSKSIWNNASPIPGLFLYTLAAIFFILGLRYLKDSFPPLVLHLENPVRKPKFGFWISSLGLAVINMLHAPYADYNDPQGYIYIALWILSIILFAISVLLDAGWQPPSTQVSTEWLKKHRIELLFIAAMVTTAFFIRFLDVENHPYSFINDEGEVGISGACLFTGECRNFFYTGWAGQPMTTFFPAAIGVALFGRTALAVRLGSVIIGTLSVLAVYLFAREVFNKKTAWVAALLLTALPVHIHFSRLGVANIVDSLSLTLILWLLFRGAKRGSTLSCRVVYVYLYRFNTCPGNWRRRSRLYCFADTWLSASQHQEHFVFNSGGGDSYPPITRTLLYSLRYSPRPIQDRGNFTERGTSK
jgi:hypothetical protein